MQPKIMIDDVALDSPAAQAGLDWDQTVLSVRLPVADSLSRYWMYLVGLGLFGLVIFMQLQQRRKPQVATEAAISQTM